MEVLGGVDELVEDVPDEALRYFDFAFEEGFDEVSQVSELEILEKVSYWAARTTIPIFEVYNVRLRFSV